MLWCLSAHEYKPLLFPGSAHAVVISTALSFVVQFLVIKYNCFNYTIFEFIASSFPILFVLVER